MQHCRENMTRRQFLRQFCLSLAVGPSHCAAFDLATYSFTGHVTWDQLLRLCLQRPRYILESTSAVGMPLLPTAALGRNRTDWTSSEGLTQRDITIDNEDRQQPTYRTPHNGGLELCLGTKLSSAVRGVDRLDRKSLVRGDHGTILLVCLDRISRPLGRLYR